MFKLSVRAINSPNCLSFITSNARFENVTVQPGSYLKRRPLTLGGFLRAVDLYVNEEACVT